jgi:hypothetical protein
MISCTEFIPAYSEGFKFLEQSGGRKQVEDFWSYLSSLYLKDSLGKLVAEEGLEGCYTYWTQALNEEAANFKIVLNEIEAEYKSNMFKCPSKGLLLKLGYMEPYHAYCDHCQALYGPFLGNLGYHYEKDLSYCENATCSSLITLMENKKNI